MTDETPSIGLDDDRIKFFADRLLEVARIRAAAEPSVGGADKEDLAIYAGEVVALRAENARLRADAQAAVALVVQKAARDARDVFSDHKRAKESVDYMEQLIYSALAPADGIAAVEALRKERDALFRRATLAEEWRDHDKARAEKAEAELAAAQQREAGLVDARRQFHDACNTYNAKWDQVQARRAENDWSLKLDEEYRAMEQSRRHFIGAAEVFADAALSNNGRGE
jgi:hypothetical protein